MLVRAQRIIPRTTSTRGASGVCRRDLAHTPMVQNCLSQAVELNVARRCNVVSVPNVEKLLPNLRKVVVS
jgi:hypothetical protein